MNQDYFNYEGVNECMNTLDTKFSEFADLLKSINDYMNNEINVTHNSALFGKLGEKVLNDWNENASTFSDFYNNFGAWSQLMASIMTSYDSFEKDTIKNAIAANETTGAKLNGVEASREQIAEKVVKADIIERLNENEVGIVQEGLVGEPEIVKVGEVEAERRTYADGSTITYTYDENGNVDKMIVEKANGLMECRTTDKDGNVKVEKYSSTGSLYSISEYNSLGQKTKYTNSTRTNYYEDGKLVSSVLPTTNFQAVQFDENNNAVNLTGLGDNRFKYNQNNYIGKNHLSGDSAGQQYIQDRIAEKATTDVLTEDIPIEDEEYLLEMTRTEVDLGYQQGEDGNLQFNENETETVIENDTTSTDAIFTTGMEVIREEHEHGRRHSDREDENDD